MSSYSDRLKTRANRCDGFILPNLCDHAIGQADEIDCPKENEICCAWCESYDGCNRQCSELSYVFRDDKEVIEFGIKNL